MHPFPVPRRTTVRRTASLAVLFAAASLQGCGGGSDGASAPAPSPAPVLSAADACAALKGVAINASDISLPTTGANVSDATLVAPSGSGTTAVGEYCKLTGSIAPVDKTAPPIQFSLVLPTTWNGKAMHLMGGGYDGSVVQGSGNVPGAAGLATPLARGYAAFGSDSGHTGSAAEASFALNDEALENYLGDQLRKTRDVAMKLIQQRYGSAPKRTYSAGGSGGGREALYVADRWPELYDGVISYYPAWSLTAMLTNYVRGSQALGAAGAWSNANKQKLLTNAVIAACDTLDGAADGVIGNVAACHFDPQTLRCPGGADTGDSCLSDAQITGFTAAYATGTSFPYALANGTNSYPAYNIFNGGVIPAMGTAAPATPSATNMPFATYIGESFAKYWVYQDASYNPFLFDLNANGFVQQREKYISSRQDVNPNLTPFASKGGKVIVVHGLADPLIPSASSEEFYHRAVTAMGANAVAASIRFYEVPGYGHGSGAYNVRYDSLAALENWVENGVAPAGQVAADANAASNGRTRPLCDYPAWPKYNGSGDINAAASYTCTN
ncbi:tannase/feruloyl esterase family alpha/beta hydrolase [Ramlibacter sp. G-1-2-2]|uniref:Tannase/feruloyl esterase family alpha/beta hydrolase n=1 Tax=Ramlibacter agri TaxID=2728837 RepID=A0A848HF74_9BURK|nr:tannase/feruloyl esterase family alpha/beta hydrolase [Ramlibacter agri]NML47183.1 tannase/feruloyl esterase family alpha/beta hydrolase [Ramlibacter agri]